MELCHTRPLFILVANFATNILQNILILCPDQLFEVKTSRKIRPGPNVIGTSNQSGSFQHGMLILSMILDLVQATT